MMFHTSSTVVVAGAHSLTFQRDLMNLRQQSLKEEILYLFCVQCCSDTAELTDTEINNEVTRE